MSQISAAFKWASEHPVPTAVGVFAVGAILLLMTRNTSAGASGDATSAAAYYAAEAQQGISGNQLAETQIVAQAATTQALAATAADVTNNTTWANVSLANTANNNAAALALAPYGVESQLIDSITQTAALPPITTTTTKSSGGFKTLFGSIGGGSKTSTIVSPNPSAEQALEELNQLLGGLFIAGHG